MSGIHSRNRCFLVVVLIITVALVLIPALAQAQTPAGTAFTYQGRLTDSGSVVDGACDFTFKLYDALGSGEPPAGGTQIGSTVAHNDVQVDSGYFTVDLDFGADAFSGDARYLEIAVDCGEGIYTLGPRQELKPGPYAVFSSAAAPQTAFFAYATSEQWIPGETVSRLVFDSELYDDGDSFNPATSQFQAPSSGTYHFDVSIAFILGQTGAPFQLSLYRNDFATVVSGFCEPGGNWPNSYQINSTLKLEAGDLIDVRLEHPYDPATTRRTYPSLAGIPNDLTDGGMSVWFSGFQVY